MGCRIEEVEGIGPRYGERLRDAGIQTTEELLAAGASREGRRKLAEQSGIAEKQLLKWVNMCDLFRIRGIGGEFAELLEAAGVDTVKELRNRNAENLMQKLIEVNGECRLVRRTPSAGQVMEWVEQARTLDPRISH